MQRVSVLVVTLVAVSLGGAGCSSGPPSPTKISTEPAGAAIFVDGTKVGDSPATYNLNFDNNHPSIEVKATKDTYVDAVEKVSPGSDDYKAGEIKFNLVVDQVLLGTVTSEAANHSLRVQVNPQMTRDAVWTDLVNFITGRYEGLEKLEEKSGYIESAPATHHFDHPYRKGATVRTQLQGNIASIDPLVYKLTIKSEIAYDDAPDKWEPYPRVMKEDDELVAKIRKAIEIAQ
jgi:hypothetical protein